MTANILNTIAYGVQADFDTVATTLTSTLLGDIMSATYTIDKGIDAFKPFNAVSAKQHLQKDLVKTRTTKISMDITFRPTSLAFLAVCLGDYTAGTSNALGTLVSKKTIPKFLTFKGNIGLADEAITFKSVAFNTLRFSITEDNMLECTASLVARTFTRSSETVATAESTGTNILFTDGACTIDGSEVSLENFDVNIDFKTLSRRVFRVEDATEKQFVNKIVRTGLMITGRFLMDVESGTANKAFENTKKDMKIVFKTGQELILKGSIFNSVEKISSAETDKLLSITGNLLALDAEAKY
jgi:hypothetical protein